MKVCFITSVYPRFETDTEVPWLREIVRRLRDAGVDIHILAPSYGGIKSHTIDGVSVHRYRYFFKKWENLTGEEGAPNKIHKLHYKVITLLYIAFGKMAAMRLHAKFRFDILHVHWPFPHTFFAQAALFIHPAKLILHFYGAELLLMRKFGFVRTFLRGFIKKADRIIAISNFTAANVRGVFDREVTVIPYGAAITQKALPASTVSGERIILCIGRMVERKGFEYAVRAMAAVLKVHPTARLVFAGGGPLLPELKELAESVGVGQSVRFTGKISNEDLAAQFCGCEMFVMPSIVDSRGDTEGLGVVLLEAITYGKPVIGTNVGGIPDIIKNEKTGLLVPEKDPASLAAAILRLLDDPGLRERLAAQGLEHVKTEFGWDGIIERLMKVYEDVGVYK